MRDTREAERAQPVVIAPRYASAKRRLVLRLAAALGRCALALCTSGLFAPAAAQTPADTPPPSFWQTVLFGATLEGYYEHNTNNPHDHVNLLRAYDQRANAFGLQQVALVLESPTDPSNGRHIGFRVDVQFGQAVATLQGSQVNEPRPDLDRYLWQAYGSVVAPVGRGLTIDFGKFASTLGYETNYAKDNDAFTRSYLFNFLPYYHAGLRLTLPVSDGVAVSYAITNGAQQTEDFNASVSHLVVAAFKVSHGVSGVLNLYAGQEQATDPGAPESDGWLQVFEGNVNWAATPRLSFGFEASRTASRRYSTDPRRWLTGVAAYARAATSARTAAAARYEWIDDQGGLFVGAGQRVQELTLTGEVKPVDGFSLRIEWRRDVNSAPFFTTSVPGELRKSQQTILAGLVWWIGNKPGKW